MIIREYEKKDWSAICDIFVRAKPDELRGSIDPKYMIPLTEDEGLLKSFHDSIVFVAEDEEKVIGYAGYNGTLISFLFVDPTYYRKGIGTILLERVLSEVGEKAWLRVAKGNVNAKNLYRKFGFEIAEEFTGKYNEQKIEVEVLALKLELNTWKLKNQ